MEDVAALTGHCLCGSVMLKASRVSTHYHICHCDMCRRWNGGPSMTVMAKELAIDGADKVSVYPSSDWAERAFCSKCGSNLYYRLAQGGDWFVWAGLFDDQSRLTIAREIYIDRKPPGYSFAGDHPRLTEEEFLKSIGMQS